MRGGPGGSTSLTIGEVESVRALFRSSDDGARREALERIDRWRDREPDRDAAAAILRAATLAYPWVRTQRTDPALQLARSLCQFPRSVDVSDVEAAYLVSAERARRVLLHLLALRRDGAGVGALAYLVGPDGPEDLLPLPTGGLLSPVLDVVSAPDLVPALVHAAGRAGWTWHAAEVLTQLVRDDRLDDPALNRILDGVAPVVEALVDSSDRAWTNPDALETDSAPRVGGPTNGAPDAGHPSMSMADRLTDTSADAGRHLVQRDPTRGERLRLRALVDLCEVLPADGAIPVLRRVLSSADPRVGAMGLVALVGHDAAIAPERGDLIARDPQARAELIDGLSGLGQLDRMSPDWRDGRARAEAELVRWLSADTELGVRPDEIEHVTEVPVGELDEDGVVHLFRFRLRPPHWSCARGWMVGAAGPFRADGSIVDHEVFASSVYSAEDEDDLDGHLDSILDALGTWPDVDDR